MSDMQIDVNKIIESLTNQIAAQAQRIAVLEATIASMRLMRNDAPNQASNTENNN
jgi:hypothetical protein